MAQPERAHPWGKWVGILLFLWLLAPVPVLAQNPADCIQLGHERGLRVVKSVCPNRDVMARMCSEDPEAYFNCSKRTFGMVTFGPTFHESSEWAVGIGHTGPVHWAACFVDDWTTGRCKPDLDSELNRLGIGTPRPTAGDGIPASGAAPAGSPDPFAQATQDHARSGGSPSGSPSQSSGATPSQTPGDPFAQVGPAPPGGPSDPFAQATQEYERQTRPPAPPPPTASSRPAGSTPAATPSVAAPQAGRRDSIARPAESASTASDIEVVGIGRYKDCVVAGRYPNGKPYFTIKESCRTEGLVVHWCVARPGDGDWPVMPGCTFRCNHGGQNGWPSTRTDWKFELIWVENCTKGPFRLNYGACPVSAYQAVRCNPAEGGRWDMSSPQPTRILGPVNTPSPPAPSPSPPPQDRSRGPAIR